MTTFSRSAPTVSAQALPVIAAILFSLFAAAGSVHADGAHHSSLDPLTEGWTVEPGDGSAGGSAVALDPDFPGVSSWQVDAPASATLRYRLDGPAPTDSWTLRARLRVLDLSDALDGNVSLEVASGVMRWPVTFGSNANGDTLFSFNGAGTPTLAAGQALRTDYFLIEIAYNDGDASADVFVNGTEFESDWTGIAGAFSRVNFGDGDASGLGRGRYEDVVFMIGPQACRDGIDNDGDGLVDFAGGDPDCSQPNDPSEDNPDFDSDGLRDGFEVANGFDPGNPDEDANGLIDGQEDPDFDGLGNAAEQAAGTDPNDPDSDDDGLHDGFELDRGSFGVQQVIGNTLNFARSVFAADLDGDGDEDVLSGSRPAFDAAWYENTDGTGSFGVEQQIADLGAAFVFAADVDGDGDLDVLTAGIGLAWYENLDGAGTFGPRQVIASAGNAVFASDVDGDGDMDVLSASESEDRIAWYENLDGAGNFGPQHVISTLANYASSVFAIDLDGDGDMDVLSASVFDAKIAWYENLDGAGSFGPQQVISTQALGARSVFATDLDGDGDADVLSASPNDDKIAWYENLDGAGSFGPQRLISGVGLAISVFAADVDGDGDMDVLSASSPDSIIVWYENMLDVPSSFWPEHVISTAALGARAVFASDLDGDGDVDVLSASGSPFNRIAWYENENLADPLDPDTDGDGLLDGFEMANRFDPLGTDESAGDPDSDGLTNLQEQASGTNPNIADTDGDGLQDAAEVNIHGTDPSDADSDDDGMLDGFELANGFDPFDADQNANGVLDGIEDADADGLVNQAEQPAGTDPNDADSDDDGLFDGDELGSGSFGPQQVISTLALGARSVFASDVDGDGDVDVLSASADKIAWYENTDGAGSFGAQQVISTSVDSAISVFASDLDRDGDVDVLSASTLDKKIAWYENTDGSGGFGPQQVISPPSADIPFSVIAADVDGDGDADVFSASFIDNKIAWYENLDGQGTFAALRVITTLVDRPYSLYASDVDGDGDMDLLSASWLDSKIAWYENLDGAGDFGPQQVISTLAVGARSVFATDVDGDGDADVLSASEFDDKIAWYENLDGAGNFGPQQVLSTLADSAYSVFASDVDSDGDMDVLSASALDDKIAWYENLDGAGTFGPQQVISTLAGFAFSVFASDVDGDGDVDVLSASFLDDKIAWYENENVANPLDPDSDDDGLLDGFEVTHGFDPLGADESVGDPDLDGLTNLQEQASGTNPNSADTDGDGLSDGAEVNTYGTAPLLFDTDGDGFSDGAEVAAGTDPLDGMDPPPVAVPALGGWGLALLAGLLGAIGLGSPSVRGSRPWRVRLRVLRGIRVA